MGIVILFMFVAVLLSAALLGIVFITQRPEAARAASSALGSKSRSRTKKADDASRSTAPEAPAASTSRTPHRHTPVKAAAVSAGAPVSSQSADGAHVDVRLAS